MTASCHQKFSDDISWLSSVTNSSMTVADCHQQFIDYILAASSVKNSSYI